MTPPTIQKKENLLLNYIKENVLTTRILKFGTVGASGIVVNMGTLYLLTESGLIPYFIASIIAIELSILSNFTINYLWTWRDRHDAGTVWAKLARYHIVVGITAYLGNYMILIGLTELVGLHYLLSNIIGIGVAMMANFVINDLWTFRKRESAQES